VRATNFLKLESPATTSAPDQISSTWTKSSERRASAVEGSWTGRGDAKRGKEGEEKKER
jgi:hypothetical protein